jgi:hypothetical protein
MHGLTVITFIILAAIDNGLNCVLK